MHVGLLVERSEPRAFYKEKIDEKTNNKRKTNWRAAGFWQIGKEAAAGNLIRITLEIGFDAELWASLQTIDKIGVDKPYQRYQRQSDLPGRKELMAGGYSDCQPINGSRMRRTRLRHRSFGNAFLIG